MEFTDVKSKDFIELAAIPEQDQVKKIAEQRVKWRLREALQANGIHEPIENLHCVTVQTYCDTPHYDLSLVDRLVDAVVDNKAPIIGPGECIYTNRLGAWKDVREDFDRAAVQNAVSTVYQHIKQTEQAD
ncbi:hypothetical protein N8H41_18955 [Pseudomonas vlassakiae]|jgi:hypothetical protein|uniref:hypothetical protein n=1 Tax=Pseudomonas TaxID=286 RepID=UPI000C199285|nr:MULTISPECIES: hypothetical protein [Pseudomonas]AXQ46807.1 hypothetical protein DZC31_04320 [Stenotrophomonas rhizophila]MBS3188550.1 hypothetical protein [Pseudomonas sp. PCH44]MCU0126056.1 hypothetical protein [Pseudomonas vlassakiae]PIK78970.1 hypothetical protein CQW31_07845 [Pseudomonas sp. 382]HCV40945.1 hypothetical protein [Pseudomonas sp.]